MHDSDVRGALRGWLAEKYAGPSTRFVEEMGIWSGSVRIDMAVINGRIHGFEIKSERDTLSRLEGQADLYSQVFDRVTLVAAHKHISKAEIKIPTWWGIARASVGLGGAIVFKVVRQAKQNPKILPLQVARLLWRAEALDILQRRGLSRGYKSRTADEIFSHLAESLSMKELSQEVRTILKRREGWLGQPISNEANMTTDPIANPFSPPSRSSSRRSALGDLLDFAVAPTSD
jgi:hypothetical protein